MPAPRTYGFSTALYHSHRLGREQLREIAAAGFTAVELAATRTHFDYHRDSCVADLQQWLAECGLALTSVHAPTSEAVTAGRALHPLWLASADAAHRAHALAETERALHVARRIPFATFIVHIGASKSANDPARSTRDGARRSIEALHRVAAPLGVRLAIEVATNELSAPGSLVHFVEDVLDVGDVGICLDLGHGHLTGDLIDATEIVSEHLLAVDVHDNRGRNDDHLMPFEGTIEWPAVVTTLQKVGYAGPWMFDVHGRGPAADTLTRARKARQQIDRLLAD